MKFFLMFCFAIQQSSCKINLAAGKSSTASSYYLNNSLYSPSKANDGNYDQVKLTSVYFKSNDPRKGGNWWMVDLGVKYFIDVVNVFTAPTLELHLNQFIVGLSNSNLPVIRNAYDICDQLNKVTVLPGSYAVKCNANLPDYRMVIVQLPTNGLGGLAFVEVEVFAPGNPDAKFWTRFANFRLKSVPTETIQRPTISACVADCSARGCFAINFSYATLTCEIFQTLVGQSAPYFPTSQINWDYWKMQYA